MKRLRDPEEIIPLLPESIRPMARAAWDAKQADPNDRERFSKPLREAFEAVKYPKGHCVDPATLDADALLVAEFSCGVEGAMLHSYGIPLTAWARSRWLGFSAPTIAERRIDYVFRGEPRNAPLYRAVIEFLMAAEIKIHMVMVNEDLVSLLASLSPMDKLDLMPGFAFECYRVSRREFPKFDSDSVTAKAGPWAIALARRFTETHERGLDAEELTFGVEEPLRRAIFLGLIRSGTEIDPTWDWLVPAEWNPWRLGFDEILASLPEPRRTRALIESVGDARVHPATALNSAEALLYRIPSLEMAEFVLQLLDGDAEGGRREREWLPEVAEALKDRPEIASLFTERFSRLPVLPALRLRRFFKPRSADELTESERRQFAYLGRHWSADDERTFMVRGTPDAPEFGPMDFVTIYEIEDGNGALVYEAILYCHGLNGAVMYAGTLDLVGMYCQHSLEMRDETEVALKEALETIIEDADE